MNPLQFALMIRKELRAVLWAAGGSKVFNDRACFVTAGAPAEDWLPPQLPFCCVAIGDGVPDEDHPDLIEQGYSLITVAEVKGDPLGEFAVIGGSTASLTKSAGRGVAEIGARVRSAVENLTGVDGAKILLSSTSTGASEAFGRGRHLALEELGLTAICTSDLHYDAPQQLKDTSNTWTWEGVHVSDRFDFLQYRLGFVAGSTPGATPADTTIVYTGTAATTTHTTVSSRAYSVFADYNARGASSVEGSSSGIEVGAFLTT